VKNTESTKTI